MDFRSIYAGPMRGEAANRGDTLTVEKLMPIVEADRYHIQHLDKQLLIASGVVERLAKRAELAEARLEAHVLAARLALQHHASERVACAGEEPTCPGCRALLEALS